ncbi:MAG TPA: mannosyltransferase family protein [Candidatus Thermoplasmatota archaeon]|nr:mannosyltransferase family protein [Candidatus Thermoplasmatota archaeon]
MSGALAREEETVHERRLAALLREPVVAIAALALLSRAAFVAVAALAGGYFPGAEDGWNRGPGFVRYFARWDSGFYMDIAEMGYGFKPEAWAFNPGYPMLVGLAWRLLPIDLPTAGFLVSHAAFAASVALLYLLTKRLFDERVAWRSCVFLAVFPGTFYLGAVYADALFLALALGALLAVATGRWWVAGALVSYAAITRPPGLFLLGALGLAVLLEAWRARAIPWRAAASVPIAAIGPVAFAVYSYAQTGDPLISNHAREVHWPNVQWHSPHTLFDLSGVVGPLKALIFLGMGLVAATMLYCLVDLARSRRWDRAPAYAFALALGVVYLSYSEPNPIIRYLATLPPVFWMLARVSESRGVFLGLVTASAALAGFVAMVFATWGPLY